MPGFRTRRLVDALTLGPRRRRRSMDRQLAELDRIEFGAQPLPPEPRSRALMTFTVVGVAVVGLVSVWLLSGSHPQSQPLVAAAGEAGATGPQTEIAPRILGAPTHTHVDQPHRLLPARHTPSGSSTAYKFMDPNGAARWEPCRAIHYVIRRGGEGSRLDAIFRSAVADVSAATGLKFVADGTTTELPLYSETARLPYLPSMYGDRWAPVLVAWSNSSESPSLGNAEGSAGPYEWAASGQPPRYVTGAVSFDTPKMHVLLEAPHGGEYARTVVLHELGHLVGLAHVANSRQIMHPGYAKQPITHYASGDLAGLAVLGAGPCYADF